MWFGRGNSSVDYWQPIVADQLVAFVLCWRGYAPRSCEAFCIPNPFSCWPFISLPKCRRVPCHINRTLPKFHVGRDTWQILQSSQGQKKFHLSVNEMFARSWNISVFIANILIMHTEKKLLKHRADFRSYKTFMSRAITGPFSCKKN
jgi:hypothetical protein